MVYLLIAWWCSMGTKPNLHGMIERREAWHARAPTTKRHPEPGRVIQGQNLWSLWDPHMLLGAWACHTVCLYIYIYNIYIPIYFHIIPLHYHQPAMKKLRRASTASGAPENSRPPRSATKGNQPWRARSNSSRTPQHGPFGKSHMVYWDSNMNKMDFMGFVIYGISWWYNEIQTYIMIYDDIWVCLEMGYSYSGTWIKPWMG